MEEVKDRSRVGDERHREDRNDNKKERDLDHKISAGFVPEVFAADVKKRWLRAAAVIAIKREDLIIAISEREPRSGAPAVKNAASPAMVFFRARFHCLLTFLL